MAFPSSAAVSVRVEPVAPAMAPPSANHWKDVESCLGDHVPGDSVSAAPTFGVPLMCGEPQDYSAFRIGLFGLDKLADVDGTLERLRHGLDRALA